MKKFSAPLFWLLLMSGLVLLNLYDYATPKAEPTPYSAFLAALEAGEVEQVELREHEIRAVLRPTDEAPGRRLVVDRLPGIDESELLETMVASDVRFSGDMEAETRFWATALSWLLPFAIIFGVYFFILRRATKGAGGAGPLTFGRTKAKIYDAGRDNRVTFADVAGIDEAVAEVEELVDFLKNPGKYLQLGAKIPKGALLVGPPGTGKTLLAKAVAGEANVPFFSLSGSDFVEMFVGVGAARVRDLFAQATARSPCIVFIDEIDAIGKSRGGIGALGTHDEREQTLNQLLAEMDGFDPRAGVVILAATNRPEILDPALVRSGRFDRRVVVDRPSLLGRRAILEVHLRGAAAGETVDLSVIARRTPGMVGADLAKVVNEAALAAARGGSATIEQVHFEEAIDRIQLGVEKRGRAMTEEEKRRVAFHEAGHALVAMSVEHADPVHRVTIIPRAIGALGATLQLPTEDRHLLLRSELIDRLTVMMGGRAAEQLVLGDASTGAQNDLERATETARQMVCRYGMSEKLGAQTFGSETGSPLLGVTGMDRNFSEETARAIDAEIRALLDGAYERAWGLLQAQEGGLRRVADRLLDVETIDGNELERLLAGSVAAPASRLAVHR